VSPEFPVAVRCKVLVVHTGESLPAVVDEPAVIVTKVVPAGDVHPLLVTVNV
jgi:hypothetical protein